MLAGFEDGPAIQALDILGVGILGDELGAGMAAGTGIVHTMSPRLLES